MPSIVIIPIERFHAPHMTECDPPKHAEMTTGAYQSEGETTFIDTK